MKLHFLKTQWSDMIILESNGKVALVDTGFEEQYEQLEDYLKKLGVSRITFILLTHFHRDHYGSLTALIQNFQVDRVYMKEYSGLDCTTAWGSVADDAYRSSEMDKYREMVDVISAGSELIPVEGLSVIPFDQYELKLFHTTNSIREIYEDEAFPDTYHRICFSENQNSIGIFLQADGKNIFLGGDILDHDSTHPKANHVCCQVAQLIGEQIDIYKAPHHGTVHTACAKALEIFKPKIAVITNEDDYLSKESDVYDNLKRANPEVRILLTEQEDVVIDTETVTIPRV